MKIIIAGGRNFKPTQIDRTWLKHMLKKLNCTEVVCGMAKGADLFGKEIAEEIHIPVKEFIPDWGKIGKLAGFARNNLMANYAEALIVFPGGNGTKHMKMVAEQHNLLIVEPQYYKGD